MSYSAPPACTFSRLRLTPSKCRGGGGRDLIEVLLGEDRTHIDPLALSLFLLLLLLLLHLLQRHCWAGGPRRGARRERRTTRRIMMPVHADPSGWAPRDIALDPRYPTARRRLALELIVLQTIRCVFIVLLSSVVTASGPYPYQDQVPCHSNPSCQNVPTVVWHLLLKTYWHSAPKLTKHIWKRKVETYAT